MQYERFQYGDLLYSTKLAGEKIYKHNNHSKIIDIRFFKGKNSQFSIVLKMTIGDTMFNGKILSLLSKSNNSIDAIFVLCT